jgi:Cu(I)-responsive transcriptional regulator
MVVGEAAKATGLSVKTIRYYEETGLVIPDRKENGYRDYSDKHIHILCFIQRARSLGFSVEDCQTLVSLYEDKSRKSADVKILAQKQLEIITEKITELQTMHHSLSQLITNCKGDHHPDCAIIDGLAKK